MKIRYAREQAVRQVLPVPAGSALSDIEAQPLAHVEAHRVAQTAWSSDLLPVYLDDTDVGRVHFAKHCSPLPIGNP